MTHAEINMAIARDILKLEIVDEGGEPHIKKPDVSLAGKLFESFVPLPKYSKRLDLALELIPRDALAFTKRLPSGYWEFGFCSGPDYTSRTFTCMTLSEAICSAVLHKAGLWVE